MRIGIDGSRAFIKNRTGIEEYSYQVIRHLTKEFGDERARLDSRRRPLFDARRVVLYVRENQVVDFELPKNWEVKIIKLKRFWTQIGLSLEMLFHPVDTLFIPAHTVPIIHPKKTVVVIHGLEYEFCPKAYSFWSRVYMRTSIKNSCKWASEIISASENTKKDLMRLYGVSSEKIRAVYEGYEIQHAKVDVQDSARTNGPYLLFIGRIEDRKNVVNIVRAFEMLKERNGIEHKLILAGKPGYGYAEVASEVRDAKHKQDIIELGFVSEEKKWELLKAADAFVFPTLYEGFGIPILEAQSVGCPVLASNNSSIPEVAGDSALLVDPENIGEIADGIYEVVSNETLKNAIIQKGLENVKRFSWEKCARDIAGSLNE